MSILEWKLSYSVLVYEDTLTVSCNKGLFLEGTYFWKLKTPYANQTKDVGLSLK